MILLFCSKIYFIKVFHVLSHKWKETFFSITKTLFWKLTCLKINLFYFILILCVCVDGLVGGQRQSVSQSWYLEWVDCLHTHTYTHTLKWTVKLLLSWIIISFMISGRGGGVCDSTLILLTLEINDHTALSRKHNGKHSTVLTFCRASMYFSHAIQVTALKLHMVHIMQYFSSSLAY